MHFLFLISLLFPQMMWVNKISAPSANNKDMRRVRGQGEENEDSVCEFCNVINTSFILSL